MVTRNVFFDKFSVTMATWMYINILFYSQIHFADAMVLLQSKTSWSQGKN